MNVRRGLAGTALLATTLLIVLPEITAGDIVIAILAALAGSALGFRIPLPGGSAVRVVPRRCWHLLPLVGHTLKNAAVGSWNVARIALGSRRLPMPGVIEIEQGSRSARGAAVNGLLATVSPGGLLIDVDEERGVVVFHVVGATEEEFRRMVEQLYHDHQRHVLP